MYLQTQCCEVHLGQHTVVQCWQLIFQQRHLETASGDQAVFLAFYWKYGLLNFQKLLYMRKSLQNVPKPLSPQQLNPVREMSPEFQNAWGGKRIAADLKCLLHWLAQKGSFPATLWPACWSLLSKKSMHGNTKQSVKQMQYYRSFLPQRNMAPSREAACNVLSG